LVTSLTKLCALSPTSAGGERDRRAAFELERGGLPRRERAPDGLGEGGEVDT